MAVQEIRHTMHPAGASITEKGPMVVELPKDRVLTLKAKIRQQRNTVEALKRDGHEFADADRYLGLLQQELRNAEANLPPEPGFGAKS